MRKLIALAALVAASPAAAVPIVTCERCEPVVIDRPPSKPFVISPTTVTLTPSSFARMLGLPRFD